MPPQGRQRFRNLLNQVGIAGNYGPLIRRAIIEDWGTERFVQALVRTKPFKRQYPGLVIKGQVNPALVGQVRGGITASNIAEAVGAYDTIWNSYNEQAKLLGLPRVNRSQIGTLIRGGTSPAEFGQRAFALHQVTANQQALDAFNEQRKLAGLRAYTRDDFARAIANRDQSFTDIYEATRLQLGGVGFTSEQAREIAQGSPNVRLDSSGQVISGTLDVGALLSDLRNRIADIGPELEREGITSVELAKFLSNPGDDPTGIARRIQQLEQRRRNQTSFVQGPPARRGPGGGIATGSQPGPLSSV